MEYETTSIMESSCQKLVIPSKPVDWETKRRVIGKALSHINEIADPLQRYKVRKDYMASVDSEQLEYLMYEQRKTLLSLMYEIFDPEE